MELDEPDVPELLSGSEVLPKSNELACVTANTTTTTAAITAKTTPGFTSGKVDSLLEEPRDLAFEPFVLAEACFGAFGASF